MERRGVETALSAGLLFAVLGLVAWVTGRAFVFPSLGPSAFVLAFARPGDRPSGYRVVGGHAVGALAGFLAYALVAPDVTLTATPPSFSLDGFRLVASGLLSLVATSWGMVVTDTVHAPACATTLIVSLGLLSSPVEVAIVVVSVVFLVGASEAVTRSAIAFDH